MNNEFNPASLDVPAFAEAAGNLSGTLSLMDLPRLRDSLLLDALADAPVARWQAGGEVRARRGDTDQVWLTLQVQTLAPLECQRCLETVHTHLDVDRQFRFAANEDIAAELDEQEEDDVLVLNRHFDLVGLIEDELLLVLPVVPRHDECPQPLPHAADTASSDSTNTAMKDELPHPFAKLAALKKSGDDGTGSR